MPPISRTVRIGSAHGLHARPAKLFAQAAKDAGIPVTIAKDAGSPVNAASILAALVFFSLDKRTSPLGQASGEFVLVDAAERSLDGAPALALTFSQPLDPRKNYDALLRVFEMPARPGEQPSQLRRGDEEDPDSQSTDRKSTRLNSSH